MCDFLRGWTRPLLSLPSMDVDSTAKFSSWLPAADNKLSMLTHGSNFDQTQQRANSGTSLAYFFAGNTAAALKPELTMRLLYLLIFLLGLTGWLFLPSQTD